MYTLLRRAFLFSFIGCISASIMVHNQAVFAAEKTAQRLVCLKPVRCDTPGIGCKENSPHRVRLTMDEKNPTVPNEKTYVLECVSTAKGQICTTGNADTLPELGWETSLAELQKAANYSFQGIFNIDGTPIDQLQNPLVSDTKGTIVPVEWQSSTNESTFHTFYALSFYEPKNLTGDDSTSQKQGTFDLLRDANDCTSVRWDPYGTVFDSQTLEPIPGAKVTLQQKKDTGFVIADIPGVLSTITTKEDGMFNFVVPDGVYKLDASHPSYLPVPTDLTAININYSNIYSDLYPQANSTNEITQSGGVAQHRDIALNPQPNTKGIYPIKVMDYYEGLSKLTNTLIIKGRVSHPFTRVKTYIVNSETNEKVRYIQTQIQADKAGVFAIQINLSVLKPGERIGGLEFEKVDFTNPLSQNKVFQIFSRIFHSIIPAVSAQVTKVQTTADLPIEPIVNALDGFAYDGSGKVIPNATVGVYLSFSKKPYYETTADEKGYFKISSEFLPSIPFTLQYKNANGVATNTTLSKFLAQNSQYIQASSINPFVYKNVKGQVIIPTATVTPVKTVNNDIVIPEQKNEQIAFMIVVVIILLFGVIGTIAGVYIFNSKGSKP